jgi:hypothetical protein
MILPIYRSLVGARVERISSAGAPEMCPFEKQSKNIKTVRRKLAAIFAADQDKEDKRGVRSLPVGDSGGSPLA